MSVIDKVVNQNRESLLRRVWNDLEIWVSVISMIGALSLCFTQVVLRYVFQSSISWSEEIAKWFVVWMTFAGSAYAFKIGAHIGVEAFINILPSKAQTIVKGIARALTMFFILLMIFYGGLFFVRSLEVGQVAPASRLPMVIVYAALPIGFILCLARLLDMSLSEIKNKQSWGGNKI